MIWTILLSYFISSVLGDQTELRKPFFYGHVFENSPPGSKLNGLIIPIKRIDPQKWCSEVGSVHLILLGEGSAAFHMYYHHKHGHILMKTTKSLDREVQSEYVLQLGICCQSCSSKVSIVAAVALLKVDVLDINDHEPTFNNTNIKITLDDATALRSVVYKVTAWDADTGKNAELFYSIQPKNGNFYVVPKTGEVLLVDSILGLASPIKFDVFTRDHGKPALTSPKMEVEIFPRRWSLAAAKTEDHYPGLLKKRRSLLQSENPVVITVSEDASIGSVVMSLNPIRFKSASFELMYPPVENSPVTVTRDTGDIVIARRLDRETEPVVEITVKIQDKRGEDWYLIRVELIVTDVNDNVPEWAIETSPFLTVVSPGASSGTVVFRLLARDGDEGINGEVEYFLSDGGDGRFDVDRKSGLIKTTGLPLLKDKEYLLNVFAADKLGNRGQSAVVSVIAGPRAPQFTYTSYSISIPENTPEGQPFLVVTAKSFQEKALIYSLLINPSSLFSIQKETGEISLTQSVDFENDQHRYLLLVRATESQDQLSSAAEVLVMITDENDCIPEFLQSIYSKESVLETVTTATSLLQVSANDCDSGLNAEISYYTLSPDFTVSAHGTIFPARQLDYERPNHLYEFVIMAVDKGEPPRTGTATVRIRMSNVNDEPPEFSQTIYRTFVSEDAGPNTLVATVQAKDPDGDGLTYKITTGNVEGNFVIDSQKGDINFSA